MATKFIEVPLVEPSYMTLTSYERNFPLTYWRQVFGEYWVISAYTSALYVILVFGGRWFMSSRAPFKLNRLLTVWNVALATMSIYAFLRVAPEFLRVLFGKNGFHNSVCEWYHHVTTLMSWWVMYNWYEPVQQWYVVMNSFVHSFMYTYYALRSMKIRVPRPIAMFITTIQLLQMVLGVTVSLYTVWIMSDNPDRCPHRNWFGLKVSFGIYVPYTILFAKLFIDSYLMKPKPKTQQQVTKKGEHTNGVHKKKEA